MKLNLIYSKAVNLISKVSENPGFEAKELIKHICRLSETDFLLGRDKEIPEDKAEQISECINSRVDGTPLQYIIGEWDFMGHTFKVGEGVLIPRPETEILCQYVIDELTKRKSPCVIDLCSGSGCIAISIKLTAEKADVLAIEKSEAAYNYLTENNNRLCPESPVTIINRDVFKYEDIDKIKMADVIVSNPPYIRSDEIASLQKEVRREPVMALDGGVDGLLFYRFIISEWKQYLKNDGIFAFECGEEQAGEISEILKENGFDSFVFKDYNDIDRFVIGRRY